MLRICFEPVHDVSSPGGKSEAHLSKQTKRYISAAELGPRTDKLYRKNEISKGFVLRPSIEAAFSRLA